MSVSKTPWVAVGIAPLALRGHSVGRGCGTGRSRPCRRGMQLRQQEDVPNSQEDVDVRSGGARQIGARPVTEGAIIFRSGDKLYIVDPVPGGETMDLLFEGPFASPFFAAAHEMGQAT